MYEDKKVIEELYLDNTLDLRFDFQAGDYKSRFFNELKDKKIWASRCPKCGHMHCPPRIACGKCDVQMTEWVEQGDEGTLSAFQVRYYEFVHPRSGKTRKVPWADCQIRLDGGALLWHFITPADPKAHKIGDRYKAVWKDGELQGHPHDIKHFRKMEPNETPNITKPKICTEAPPLREYVTHPIVLKGPYKKWAGKESSKFFQSLRDDEKIIATKCEKCSKVYAPPETICPECYEKVDQWVELPGTGTVTNFTVVNYAEPSHPYPAPFAYALIKLDGADTAMAHIVAETDFDKLQAGLRVEPVFRQTTKGDIMDIKYFRPL